MKDCESQHKQSASLWVNCPAHSKDQLPRRVCIFSYICVRVCLCVPVGLSKQGGGSISIIHLLILNAPLLPNALPLLSPTFCFCSNFQRCRLAHLPSSQPFPLSLSVLQHVLLLHLFRASVWVKWTQVLSRVSCSLIFYGLTNHSREGGV